MRINIYVIVLSLLTPTMALASSSDWREKLSSKSTPMVFDVSLFNINSNIMKKAALVAMVRRKWEIENIEDTYVIGTYGGTKAMISFESAQKITIGYIEDFEGLDNGWLVNLKKDMLYETARCGNFE